VQLGAVEAPITSFVTRSTHRVHGLCAPAESSAAVKGEPLLRMGLLTQGATRVTLEGRLNAGTRSFASSESDCRTKIPYSMRVSSKAAALWVASSISADRT
jgi:hypothetical protein